MVPGADWALAEWASTRRDIHLILSPLTNLLCHHCGGCSWHYSGLTKSPLYVASDKKQKCRAPYVFGMLSFLATLLFVVSTWLFPRSPLPAPVEIVILLGLAFYVLRTVLAMSGDAQKWKESQQVALLTGALAFYIVLAPFKEWFPQNGQDMRGMTFVAVGAALFLVGLNWWVRSRTPSSQQYISEHNTYQHFLGSGERDQTAVWFLFLCIGNIILLNQEIEGRIGAWLCFVALRFFLLGEDIFVKK